MLYGVNAKEIQINPILTLSPWLSRQVCWCLWFCLVLLFPPFILCWWNSSQRWPAVSRRGRTLTDSSRALEEGRKAAGRAGTSLPRAHPSTEVLLPAHMRLLSNNRPLRTFFPGCSSLRHPPLPELWQRLRQTFKSHSHTMRVIN